MTQHVNRLAQENSPYLRQHQHNPVDWYPWGEEALARARHLNRPIFLSIGYSACHWCHVMEHESFENEEIGRVLNEHFVSIKVDREERPDLDQIYMAAVQMMTGQGGWPMSSFLTPEGRPFYAGTYFPPEDRYGRPGFRRLLLAIVDAWQNRREEVLQSAAGVAEQIRNSLRLEPEEEGRLPSEEQIQRATVRLGRAFDPNHGGFGQAPKFPHPMDLRLLLRAAQRFGDDQALNMVRLTLDRMAMGGIYDQLGGGFHRYSTDPVWLVPHFEKMLYDNALLTLTYVEALQLTGDPFYREVIEETLGYIQREMTSPEGAFFSTQDADSEGEEGKFFVWSEAEVRQHLGKDVSDIFGYVYNVTPGGNWEGHTILHRSKTLAQSCRLMKIEEAQLRQILTHARKKLFDARSQRIWPGRDEKVLTSWNGLMITAYANAACALDRPEYARAAAAAADFVLRTMRTPEGRLLRTWKEDGQAKLNGYLEDYAYLLEGLIALYETTFEPRWIEEALTVTSVMIDQFWDPAEGGFFYTGRDHETLIARTKDPHDNATPSGNGVAVTALLRLAKLTGRQELRTRAEETLRLFRPVMEQAPGASAQMLMALDFYLTQGDEWAIVGNAGEADTQRVLRALRRGFRPNQVVALKPTSGETTRIETVVPLLVGKSARDGVTTYRCRNFTCEAPLVGAEAVEGLMG